MVPSCCFLTTSPSGAGKPVGVAINPATPIGVLDEILPDVDLVLVMTVNPGFGGQKFLEQTLDKIARLRGVLNWRRPGCHLEHRAAHGD